MPYEYRVVYVDEGNIGWVRGQLLWDDERGRKSVVVMKDDGEEILVPWETVAQVKRYLVGDPDDH